ncbi:MAG: HNH endonuclease [bacterium]|nr:HNH endonuclease [bacterium]
MSEHRRPRIPFTDAPRGVCRWCGKDILYSSGEKQGAVDRRRRWHRACVDAYNTSDPREARRRIRKRDRGHCAICKVDTYRVRRELKKLRRGRAKATRERGYKPGKSFWELDHIVALIDGGSHDDDNLQSLCTPCHKRKTAKEARTRAARKREVDSLPEIVVRGRPIPWAESPQEFDTLFAAADAVNERVAEVLAKATHNESQS